MNNRIDLLARRPQSSDDMKRMLARAGLPIETWGEGPTKTPENLWQEIVDGETILMSPLTKEKEEEYGEIIRLTSVLAVDVFTEIEGELFHLREDRQVFKDGRGERRRDYLMTSLGEKIKHNEDRDEAVLRAVQEELGLLEEAIASVTPPKDKDEVIWRKTETYPELPSRFNSYQYEIHVKPEAVNLEQGYMEDQPEKQIYFVWDKVDTATLAS